MPEYKFMFWNEKNCDISAVPFVEEAYYMKKYAFVSDYFRMKVLYEYGGIYLDTDVEMIKSLQPLVDKGEFIGMEVKDLYSTGVICVAPRNDWVRKMLDYYEHKHFFTWKGMIDSLANTIILTQMYPAGSLPIKNIYPLDYLSAKDWRTGENLKTNNTYCIHHYSVSWGQAKINRQVLRIKNYWKFLFFFLKKITN